MVAAVGLGVGVVTVVELDLPGDLALLGVWVFAVTDGVLRYAMLVRQQA